MIQDWCLDIFHATRNPNLRREVQGGFGEHGGGRPGISDAAGSGQDGGCSVPSTSHMARTNPHRKRRCVRGVRLGSKDGGQMCTCKRIWMWFFPEHTVSPMSHLELKDETQLKCLWLWALLVNLPIALSLTNCCLSRCALGFRPVTPDDQDVTF